MSEVGQKELSIGTESPQQIVAAKMIISKPENAIALLQEGAATAQKPLPPTRDKN